MKKNNQPQRKRGILLLYVGIVILLGLSTRKLSIYPAFIQSYGGDVLWAMMMYGIFALFRPKASIRHLFLTTLVFSWLIEASQLLSFSWLVALRATPLYYILGQGFVWSDLVCYTIGCSCAALLEQGRAYIGGQKNE